MSAVSIYRDDVEEYASSMAFKSPVTENYNRHYLDEDIISSPVAKVPDYVAPSPDVTVPDIIQSPVSIFLAAASLFLALKN